MRATVLQAGALAGSLLLGVLGAGVAPALAATTPMVNLGQASTYAVLSGASVGNTVSPPAGPHTTLRGDLGVKVATRADRLSPRRRHRHEPDRHPGRRRGPRRRRHGVHEVKDRTGGAALAGALAGTTIPPGLHTIAGAASNTTTVTLDGGGNPNAVFVFQINGAMAFAAGSHVVLTNGARASRVFWQVNGAGAVGANADFAGTLMAMDAVAMGAGTMVNGRAFARNGALTLDANEFYSSPPAVSIAGGSAAITTDTTPTISGTTDVEAPGIVTVTVGGQTLTATPSDGAWSVTSPLLANATYAVVASVTDAVGNTGSATQQLTVDTVLPVVTIDDGPSVLTNDPTPTITGTSDAAVGTVIRVTIDAQTRKALVHSDATWNVTPTRADRRHPHRHRRGHRPRRQRGHRQPAADRRHHRSRGHDPRRRQRADERRDARDLRNGGRRARPDRDRLPRRRDAQRCRSSPAGRGRCSPPRSSTARTASS